MLAALTKSGLDAAEATTSLNRMFLTLVDTDENAAAAFERMGIGWDTAAVSAKGFAAVLNEVAAAADGDINKLQEMFPEMRAFRAASIAAGEANGEFNRILGVTEDSLGATDVAFGKMQGALQNQWALLKNKLNAAWLSFGSVTLPMVTGAMKALNATFAGHGFGSVSEAIRGMDIGDLEGAKEFNLSERSRLLEE